MNSCKRCGSMAINPKQHGRVNSDMNDLCDVCYWRKIADDAHEQLEKCYSEIADKEKLIAEQAKELWWFDEKFSKGKI